MLPDQKRSGLIRFLTAGLLRHSDGNTLAELGDRSQYIGLSDIGKAIECMRSAVADKAGITEKTNLTELKKLSDEQVAAALKEQLILQRGHWQEFGIEKAIGATESHSISQLEISIEHNGLPIKAHLDFTIVRDIPVPALRILELKSNEHIPEHLYASYEAQLYGQIGMLYDNWNQPCFSIPSAFGNETRDQMTFPVLALELFGVELPDDPAKVDIEGWVVSISMSEIKPFGPYVYDKVILNTCYAKAEQLWDSKIGVADGSITLDEISYANGFHPLCDYCAVSAGCPKFKTTLVHDTEYNLQLDELAGLKEKEKIIGERKKYLERLIKDRYLKAAIDCGDWLSTGDYRFKVTQIPGRKHVNFDRLSEFVGEDVEDIIHQCQENGKPYERLYVSRAKPV